MDPLLTKTLLRFLLLISYGLFAAWIFTLIEKKEESGYQRMGRMLDELKMEMDVKYNMTSDDFERFVMRASAAVEEGEELDWTLANSFLFVCTTFSTIGYGNITPKTNAGKIVIIPICIIGITMIMLAFKTTGELLASRIRLFVIKTEKAIFKTAEPKHVMRKTICATCIAMITLHVSVTVSTSFIENWSFLDSFYTIFISFTTIGFGDYVPFAAAAKGADRGGTGHIPVAILLLLFYIPYCLGLSLVSCLFSCLVDSMDDIRLFRDRLMDRCLNLFKKGLCCKA